MLMVVFGAGASYDSVPDANWGHDMRSNAANLQPPVAKNLFDLRRPAFLTASKRFDVAGVGGLIMELQAAAQHKSPSVEEFLQTRALWAEGGDVDVQCHLLGVRYYLMEVVEGATSAWEELADGHTNYRPLLNKINQYRRENDESVLLVTFNYDLLLEHALNAQLGIEKPHLQSYPDGPYHLIKPHGSTNWFRVNEGLEDLTPAEVIREGGLVDQSMPVTMSKGEPKPGWLPALAVPTTSKSSFECPPEHVDSLEALLAKVDRLLVVGWQGQEETFLEMCADRIPAGLRGLVISHEIGSAEKIAGHLSKSIPDSRILASPSTGFSNALRGDRTVEAAWKGEPEAAERDST
jgi:hypothetical protein